MAWKLMSFLDKLKALYYWSSQNYKFFEEQRIRWSEYFSINHLKWSADEQSKIIVISTGIQQSKPRLKDCSDSLCSVAVFLLLMCFAPTLVVNKTSGLSFVVVFDFCRVVIKCSQVVGWVVFDLIFSIWIVELVLQESSYDNNKFYVH